MHYGQENTPDIRPWPQPLTLEQYEALTPEKLEIVDGYLIDGPGESEARTKLLAALLLNCGLEAAVDLAHWRDWKEALEARWGPKMSW